MKTKLDIAFIDNNTGDLITFVDQSTYNSSVPIVSPLIEVYYPDYDSPIKGSYVPNAINKIHVPVLDGFYRIDISVAPNDKTKQTFHYLKAYNFEVKLKDQIKNHAGSKEAVLKLMDSFKFYMAAKEMALHDLDKAKVIFEYAKSLC